MERGISNRPRAGDAAVLGALLAAALILFLLALRGTDGGTVCIRTPDGTERVPLDRDGTYTVVSLGHTLTVAVEDGAVRVAASDCENQICVKSGAIRRAGQSIVCAPAQLVITVEREEETDADWILP